MSEIKLIHKVCGMTDQRNLDNLLDLEIDWVGMIFYPKSKRFISEPILSTRSGTKRIGVFVNATQEEIDKTILEHQLDGLQLHGAEPVDLCRHFMDRGIMVIKAIPIASEEDFNLAEKYHGHINYLLFDTKGPAHGGHGYAFDWRLLDAYSGETSFILAGGIGPRSCESIKAISHPKFAGIDINSKFEIKPGFKDILKIKQFKDALYS